MADIDSGTASGKYEDSATNKKNFYSIQLQNNNGEGLLPITYAGLVESTLYDGTNKLTVDQALRVLNSVAAATIQTTGSLQNAVTKSTAAINSYYNNATINDGIVTLTYGNGKITTLDVDESLEWEVYNGD